MKTIFTLLFSILFLNLAFAGDDTKLIKVPFDSITNKYAYKKIIEVREFDAKNLYLKAKKWYTDEYLKSIFLSDQENVILVQIGQFDISAPVKVMGREIIYSYKVIYTISSQFKDGKCKLEITNFKLTMMQAETAEQSLEAFKKNCETRPVGAKAWNKHALICFSEIDKMTQKIMDSFENNIKGVSKPKSDW